MLTSTGPLANILVKRARHALQADTPRDPTFERRVELSRYRNKLARASDDAVFEQAALDYDALLDTISDGIGKTHAITQEECDAESTWLCEMLETRAKTLADADMSPHTPALGSAPAKKKQRHSLGGASTPGTPGEKKDIVTWSKFHTINSTDMQISTENAISTEKDVLKLAAKAAKAYVTTVENAKEILRILQREIPSVHIDPERITSDLVTTRTVKSDHLKFWYLKPNFKDKDVDLLLRVARHKTGLSWDVSYGVLQPTQNSMIQSSIAGFGQITAAAAVAAAASAPEFNSATAEANALAMLAGPAVSSYVHHMGHDSGQLVRAVIVTDNSLGSEHFELSSLGASHHMVAHESMHHHHHQLQLGMEHTAVSVVDHGAMLDHGGMHHHVVDHAAVEHAAAVIAEMDQAVANAHHGQQHHHHVVDVHAVDTHAIEQQAMAMDEHQQHGVDHGGIDHVLHPLLHAHMHQQHDGTIGIE